MCSASCSSSFLARRVAKRGTSAFPILRWGGIGLCLLIGALCVNLLAGCQQTQTAPAVSATPTVNFPLDAPPPPVTPEAVASQLTQVATLDEAARQFAAALRIESNDVRVRIFTGACTICSLTENQENSSLAGLSVADASRRVQAGNQVYLAVPRFVCIYDYDGSSFTPRECRQSPL